MTTDSTTTHYDWEGIERRELHPGIHVRLLDCDSMTVGDVVLDEGTEHPWHSHEAEQVCMVQSGLLRAWVGQPDADVEPVDAGPGQILRFPSNVPHKVEAVETVAMVEVSGLVRTDLVELYAAAGG